MNCSKIVVQHCQIAAELSGILHWSTVTECHLCWIEPSSEFGSCDAANAAVWGSVGSVVLAFDAIGVSASSTMATLLPLHLVKVAGLELLKA